MKPLTAAELAGNWATLLLPINADDTIDYARLDAELAYLTAAGVNGLSRWIPSTEASSLRALAEEAIPMFLYPEGGVPSPSSP